MRSQGTDDGFIGYMDDVNIITTASNAIYLYLVEILLLKCYWESHSYVTILLIINLVTKKSQCIVSKVQREQ
jgi:uncharacterized membrane protein YkvA (DUF1232 family)